MRLRAVLLFVLFIGLNFSYQALALASPENQSRKQSSNQQLKVKSAQQAASIVQSRYGGKVLKVQRSQSNYRVKLIRQDGRIITVNVDAKTGKIRG